MDEVEAVERMPLVLDAAIHVRATRLARVPLDGLRSVDDVQLVAVLEHANVLARHHRHDGKYSALRFPALGAAAGMVVGDVALDSNLDRLVLAFADKCSAGEAGRAFLYTVVY